MMKTKLFFSVLLSFDLFACTGDYLNHPNGGGKVAVTASVDETVYVEKNATICGKAQVREFVRALTTPQSKK